MARQDDLREVMRGLVAPESKNIEDSAGPPILERRRSGAAPIEKLRFSELQTRALLELRDRLREHTIEASEIEIALALLDALARRPALCRGLLAAYLTGR